ncbi:MAG: HupE/UreJ family protein [Acidobacteria bacterium]|nr:HupE/UreJ family protein [Acidobacteriota bacterium]
MSFAGGKNNRIAKLVPALCLILVFLIAAVASAFAHDPGLSAAVLKLEGDQVNGHLTFARADIESLVPIDSDRDGKITAAEFAQAKPHLELLAAEAIAVTVAGHPVQAVINGVEPDDGNGIRFKFSFAKLAGQTFIIESKLIERLARGHRQYLELIGGEKLVGSKMLTAGSISYQPAAATLAEAAKAGQSFKEFFILGIEHIITGFDHLAFLFALLLAGSKLREAAKIITSFTIAHSITLALATFNVVNLPSWIVEPMIAVSIVYVGLENIFRRDVKNRWLLTFAFGLIHGFGFASVLRELGIGGQGSGAIVPLFSFNFGVELGQIAIATLILPLIWKLREQPKFTPRYVPAFSMLIALAGCYWLIQRTLLS